MLKAFLPLIQHECILIFKVIDRKWHRQRLRHSLIFNKFVKHFFTSLEFVLFSTLCLKRMNFCHQTNANKLDWPSLCMMNEWMNALNRWGISAFQIARWLRFFVMVKKKKLDFLLQWLTLLAVSVNLSFIKNSMRKVQELNYIFMCIKCH